MVVVPIFVNPYAKKEEAKKKALKQRKTFGFMFGLLAVVTLSLRIFIFSKVTDLFEKLRVSSPDYLQAYFWLLPLVSALLIALGLYLIFSESKEHEKKIDRVLQQYKKGELVNLYKLSDNNLMILWFITAGIVGVIIFGLVMPIYTISDRI